MAHHKSTPSHVAYLTFVLVIANTKMARIICRRLHNTMESARNQQSKRHGRTTRISTNSCFLRSPWFSDCRAVFLSELYKEPKFRWTKITV
jgi:hypothetical protein